MKEGAPVADPAAAMLNVDDSFRRAHRGGMEPIEILLNWYQALAPEIKIDLAALTTASLPHQLVEGESGGIISDPEEFVRRARQWSEGMPSRQVGAVLMIAAVVDMMISTRDDKDDWQKGAEFQEFLKQRHPEMAELADRQIREMPLRAQRWISVASEWKGLREEELSQATLLGWLRRQR